MAQSRAGMLNMENAAIGSEGRRADSRQTAKAACLFSGASHFSFSQVKHALRTHRAGAQ